MDTVLNLLMYLAFLIFGISIGRIIGEREERKWTNIWRSHCFDAMNIFRDYRAIFDAYERFILYHPEFQDELNQLFLESKIKIQILGTEPAGKATVRKTDQEGSIPSVPSEFNDSWYTRKQLEILNNSGVPIVTSQGECSNSDG